MGADSGGRIEQGSVGLGEGNGGDGQQEKIFFFKQKTAYEMHDRLEGMYHLVESEDLKQIGSYLASQGAGLQDFVPASDLLAVLRKIDRASLDPVAGCVLPEVFGDALRALGDLQPALLEYRNAVQRWEVTGRAVSGP